MAGTVPFRAGRVGASAAAKAAEIRAERDALGAGRSSLARAIRAIYGPSAGERRLLAEARNWQNGADGERMLAATLERRCTEAVFLHDLAIPGGRANIDHVAFAPTGVHVIDAKRHRGKIRVERVGSQTRLVIAGRNRTSLVTALERQVSLIDAAIKEIAPGVPVHGCLCFVPPQGWLTEAELPMFRTLEVNAVPLYSTRRLVRRLCEAGPVTPALSRELRRKLGVAFPPASPA